MVKVFGFVIQASNTSLVEQLMSGKIVSKSITFNISDNALLSNVNLSRL